MQIAKDMLNTHPKKQSELNMEALVDCIRACHECEVACNACADACLAETDVQSLVRCIRTDQDCADVCVASGRMLTRQTESSINLVAAQVDAMELACRLCAEECERHAQHHEHCRICAESCRKCEHACRHMMEALAAATA